VGTHPAMPTRDRDLRVAIASTYPPRACGIGTFSRDLRDALLGAEGVRAVDVAAIVRDEGHDQAPEVVACISQECRGDYATAARVLDRRKVDVVVLQHEFGIFGGDDGAFVVGFARDLRLPLVVTLHTVLSQPSPGQAETLRALCRAATLVTVFTETARRMIVDAGVADPERVRVLPHGGPTQLLPHDSGPRRLLRQLRRLPEATQRALGVGGPLLATFGLISPGKGIEVAIRAMPAILARHPSARYLVSGQTHPEVARLHGEEYRLSLERLVVDLGLEEHVVFDNRFLSVEDLASMLSATTVYLTPYRSREQIVSGALTFAVVAGCPVVSTPYHYAEDLLATGAGTLVPFDDHDALAAAVCELLDEPQRLAHARAVSRAIGRELAWPEVGRQTVAVLREAVALGPRSNLRPGRPPRLTRPRDAHLLTLVDNVGIVQHAAGVVPLRGSGYCVDDVARLAIVALWMLRASGSDTDARRLALSLSFLEHAWALDGSGMHNFLSYDRRWLDPPHGGDHLGRAAWALGEVVAAETPPALREPSRLLLCKMLDVLAEQRSPRTMAFAMIGLARAGLRAGGTAAVVLHELTERLVAQQRANASADWHWPEDGLHYDNARLPQALIAAGARLGSDEVVDEGLAALRWYGAEVDIDGPFIRLVGHNGRRRGEHGPGAGDEQPLDATALVDAYLEAFRVTGDERFADCAMRAFEWFLGRNRLGRPIYDFATGGCSDGLGTDTVNINQGAESTLAYLQARLALDAAGLEAPRWVAAGPAPAEPRLAEDLVVSA
jgi:glycosyltransferase involved in cell wall biosynthesis